MMNTTEKITYCNGFRHNGDPAEIDIIRPIFDERRSVAFKAWRELIRNQNTPRDIAGTRGVQREQ